MTSLSDSKSMRLKRSLADNLHNILSWHTNRKIVVIESDDWGSIRMPSKDVYEKLLKEGLDLNAGDGLRYSRYDSLATSSDLELLFETLGSIKDFNNVSPAFTALSVVANPDFEKIRNNDFREYYYEPFTETLKRYTGSDKTFNLWQEGIKNRIFVPQFHGREHLNVSVWMEALRANDYETHVAFKEGLWAFVPKHKNTKVLQYEAAFQLSEISDLELHKDILKDGLNLFEKVFGYKAKYFVPPNGNINNILNSVCSLNGIRYRSSSKIQHETLGNGQTKKVLHWLGQKEANGIRYIIRNCFFEPSQSGKNWVDCCLNDIKNAFRLHQPAIISSHRVNYIGTLDIANRDDGLKELKKLLSGIKRAWPNVEFLTTDQLGALMDHIEHS